MPRDYAPLAEAPALRELIVTSCPPVQMEVAAINAGLPPWDDVFLLPDPRPLPPLRLIVAPMEKEPRQPAVSLDPADNGLPDTGLREAEGRWVSRCVHLLAARAAGMQEWGTVDTRAVSRTITARLESFDALDRLPQIVDAIRTALAALRGEYWVTLMIDLKVRPPEPTPAQKEMEEKFQNARDEWEYEQHQRDQQAYLERLHQMELKKQSGEPVEAEDFSPEETDPYPVPPWKDPDADESAEDGDDDEELDFSDTDGGEGGGTQVKEKPDPPPSYMDDEHPLANNYNLMVTLLLDQMWIMPHQRGLACHLMNREPDEEIPEDPEPPPAA